MSLKNISIKSEYRSLVDNIVSQFYIPLLNEAISYKRAVGFFSSSSLIEISKGITGLIRNGGKIQLIASPYLSKDDIVAMKKGYELRETIIEKALLKELCEPLTLNEKNKLELLAGLIADNILDIKIALLEKNGDIGMFHEKMGIVEDIFKNQVAFAGSMNESANAMKINYESIDVFTSWSDSKDIRERVSNKERAFDVIWNNLEPNIRIVDVPRLKEQIISRYKSKINYLDNINKLQSNGFIKETQVDGPKVDDSIKLYDYQLEAIDNWQKQDFKGIFDMATGTGKTFTGLGAIVRLSERITHELGVVIVCPYQHLVEQWVEDLDLFNIIPIIGYSSSSDKDWKLKLSKAIRHQKLKITGKNFFTFICTNATFRSIFVQEQLSKVRTSLLLVIDEAHNFGSKNLRKLLDDRFTYRLALSATINRHNDEEGSNELLKYFGKKCIEYSLERAIKENKLTPYKYYPVLTVLSDEERDIYNELSYKMAKNMIKGKDGKLKLNKYGELVAIERARIVAGSIDKICKLKEYILPYKNDSYILVYCGSANIVNSESNISFDVRQIDMVTKVLGEELGMKVAKFTSRERIIDRKIIKEKFEEGKNLQALVAIRCLDEGVNIPKIKTAFILASSTNPKEYIQRRGRVLRRYSNKSFAEIFDFITLPRLLEDVPHRTKEEIKMDLSLIKNEIKRMKEFSKLSLNEIDTLSLIWQLQEVYELYD